MKVVTIVLSVVIFAGVIVPCLSLVAQPVHSPHENPATAEYSRDPVWLLLFHSNVLNLVARGQYQNARVLLGELEYASIPDDLRYISNRYRDISAEFLTTLNTLDTLLGEVTDLLAQYRLTDARQKLELASTVLGDAQRLLKDIRMANSTMSERLGSPAASALSQLGQARDRLLEILERLEQLVNELDRAWLALSSQHELQSHKKRVPTQLTLEVTRRALFIGDVILVYGKLTVEDRPLANRELFLSLDEEALVVTTDTGGTYVTEVTIPYRYVDEMTLRAEYGPSGDDLSVYFPSESLPVVIDTGFYETSLTMSVPEAVHPGLPFIIEGQLDSTGDPFERVVTFLLDGIRLAEEKVLDQFEYRVDLPEGVLVGDRNLTATVSPERRYSGGSTGASVHVSKLPIQADIQVTPFLVLPGRVHISGRVYHDLEPVAGARVALTFGQSSTSVVSTSTDGSFTTTMAAPLDLSLAGLQKLEVDIQPSQLYYPSLDLSRWVFAVNPVSIGLLLTGLVTVGTIAYGRTARRRTRPRREVPPVEAERQERPVTPPLPGPKHGITGTGGGVVDAYMDALEALERATGVGMEPNKTLREFLRMVSARTASGIKPFTGLTAMAEAALYSARESSEEMVTEATRLATSVIKEIQIDTA